MKCGYCLPHCPTYGKTHNEADSPRGRIALIQGWTMGELEITPALEQHLDGCLTCRACESVCPSLVAYGQLADAAKARRVAASPRWRRRLDRLWLAALSSARITSMLGRFARGYQRSGWARLAERTHLASIPRLAAFHRLAVAMSVTSRPAVTLETEDSTLDLFIGCTGSSAMGSAIQATIEVSRHLGIGIRIPSDPGCCGAIMRHNGHPAEAGRQREACAERHRGRVLVGLASACIAELREHPELRETLELCDYLDQATWPPSLALSPLDARILVHEPCSHRNLLGGNQAVFRLLARIPAVQVAPLPENDRCCGAAGTYLIQQPRMAQSLVDDKLAYIRDLKPDIIVTTNPGCALHLIAAIQEAHLDVEVCHPIELIARQIRTRSTDDQQTDSDTPSEIHPKHEPSP